MGMINIDWHRAHQLPAKATLDQKVEWHVGHARNCNCRKLGGKILEEIKKRGITV